MNAEQHEKMMFVNGNLSTTFRAMDVGVDRLQYRMDGAEEFVLVTYANRWTRRVCVTGDSLRAITQDVLKAV